MMKMLYLHIFEKFEHLKNKFGFINFKVGNKDFNLKLSNRKEGIKFEAPRKFSSFFNTK